ncbi:MAG: N-acetylmuramoyl-L-alanine amidase-like domain-containing protein [Gemmatimonadales bacterium]
MTPGEDITRRELLKTTALAAAALVLPRAVAACGRENPDTARLAAWVAALRKEGLGSGDGPLGRSAIRAGELAAGSPYVANTLDAYLRAGGSPAHEPLTISLTHFDCVTLVESCLGVARLARGKGKPAWDRFGREIERMRYRGGERTGYTSRLHYFSEWIADGERRGLVKDMGAELGGAEDARPLRFMTEHRASYPALADDSVFREIGAMERRRDENPRRVIPTKRIPEVVSRIETGDVLGFATEIPGLDVTHAAFAYRDTEGTLRVLHAPLSGGVVAITRTTLPEYVAAIRRSTGILVARPIR